MAVGSTLEVLLSRLWEAMAGAGLFVAIVLIVYLPGRFIVVPALDRIEKRIGIEETAWNSFTKIVNAAFAVLAIYLAIPLSGLATTPTSTAAIWAGVTIALGFASRDVLSNLVSGAFLVTDPRFSIGDWIQWDDTEGVIEDISFRVTRIHTFDNELITVPNSQLTSSAITNPVAKDRLRVTYRFGIGYDDDIDEAIRILTEAAAEHPGILDRPAASVRVEHLGESAIILWARFWIEHPQRTDFIRIRGEYIKTVKERFDEAGIEMPYPYRQLTGEIETRAGPGADPGNN